MNRNQVEWMFLGCVVGDAVGMPVEMWNHERIVAVHTRITKYLTPTGHKYFDGKVAGSTTDATQFTRRIAWKRTLSSPSGCWIAKSGSNHGSDWTFLRLAWNCIKE